jgi:formylglycine-generating enzyme required for sulfatase activity/serine/threonine protein kinase
MTDPSPDALCPGCFAEKGGASPCPHCGYDERVARGPLLLPHRTLLQEQFLVGRVLGKPGGFGITYLGWDRKLQTQVAIKEFLPRELAGRATDQASVAPHSQDEVALFRYGLEQFLREARTLAQLDHPNIVRVRQFFEANGTAYLVMDYYEGISLAEHLDNQGGRLPEESAKQLLLPILDGLRAVHAKGFLHRDVKPQNIYLARTDSGGVRPILLDFGAARQAMGERSRSLSVVVSAGYAPFEQYQRKGTQGPWTDIYAAAAVLYRAVTGEEPVEATDRISADALKPAADFGVSKGLSDALHEALAIAPEARPQSAQEFQARLWGRSQLPPATPLSAAPTTSDAQPQHAPASSDPSPPTRGRPWWIVPAVLVPVLALLAVGLWWAQPGPDDTAWEAARQTDTEAAYRAYLSDCSVNDCGHRFQAQQRLEDLAKEADLAAREADLTAYTKAAHADTRDAYEAYLVKCETNGCGHRSQAEARLEELEKKATPPPVARRGYLQVSVNVIAASVTVDGRPVGSASPERPLNLNQGLPVGEVEVLVSAPGYQEQRRHVAIEPNAWAQAHFNLEAQPPPRLAFEPELVRIDGGCFQMGSPPSEEGHNDDERQHRVCVEDFAIGKHEVTQAQWEAVMGSNPSRFDECADCPVEQVSWNDVQGYIAKLNERTGKHYRLPTEAQWEYAARAGTQTPFWSGECIHTDQANYDGNYDYNGCGAKTGVYRRKTLPVGSLEANAWGLYDVAGNVWEWTCSLYDKDYGGAESKCAGKDESGSRSLRGGSWDGLPHWVRAANRHGYRPDGRIGTIGFRLAQD